MRADCRGLIDAIDRYIEKADKGLYTELKDDGYAKPKKTVEYITRLEDSIRYSLLEETRYILEEISKCPNLSVFNDRWADIRERDKTALNVRYMTLCELKNIVPEMAREYFNAIEKKDVVEKAEGLKLDEMSERTTDWISSWSTELGDIMQLDSHEQIENILTRGLDEGWGIDKFTRAIQDSGIRNEYYRARRTALTEVLRAHSVAQQEAFMQSPSVTGKRWVHTGAYIHGPRENHVDINGQEVSKDEPFTLIGADGEEYHPMYPRDTSLPPGESINCHCMIQSVIDENILGLSEERREELRQEALKEMDDDWERELSERNSQRAGIDPNAPGGLTINPEGATTTTRDYQCNLAHAEGKENYDAMHDLLDNCEDRNVAELFTKLEPTMKVGNVRYEGIPCYSPDNKSLYFNLEEVVSGTEIDTPYEILFHESAHSIDALKGDGKNYNSNLYGKGIFGETIRKEAKEYVDARGGVIKQDFNDHKNDIKYLLEKGYINENQCEQINGKYIYRGGKLEYLKSMAYNDISNELNGSSDMSIADVCDMFEGATDTKISGKIGHEASYWKDPNALANEAFAEMFSASITNAESLEAIKEYFPQSYEIFEDMVADYLKEADKFLKG